MFLFLHGTAMLVPLAIEAKQDVVNALLVIIVDYAVPKGIEVLAITGELLYMFLYLLLLTVLF